MNLSTPVPTLCVTYLEDDGTGHVFYLPIQVAPVVSAQRLEQEAEKVITHLLKITGAQKVLGAEALRQLLRNTILAKDGLRIHVTRYEERARATEGPDGKRSYNKAHFVLGWAIVKAILLEGLRAEKKGMK